MLRLIALLILLPLAALSQNLPDHYSDKVNDFAGILSEAEVDSISQHLLAGRRATGVQMVVVTMDRIADHGGQDMHLIDYTKKLFNQWGIGDSSRNDGLLLLVAVEDRELRLAVGSAYPVIWDNEAQRVIDRFILPEFAQDNYAAGIEAGVIASYERIATPFSAGATETLPEPIDWEAVFGFMAIAATFILIIGKLIIRSYQKIKHHFKSCPGCQERGLQLLTEIVQAASEAAQGHGKRHLDCRKCGWHSEETYDIPKLSNDSDDSDSGYGGGSSSGGGASGRW